MAENIKEEEEYVTTDLWRASFLCTEGWKFLELNETQGSRRTNIVLMVPDSSPEGIERRERRAGEIVKAAAEYAEDIRSGNIQRIIRRYTNHDALVEPLNYVAAYKGLKNEFEQLKANTNHHNRGR